MSDPLVVRAIADHLRVLASAASPERVDGKVWSKRDQIALEYYSRFKDVKVQQAYEAADAFLKYRKEMLEKKP